MTQSLGMLVGVDRSDEGNKALDWAAAEAVARGSRLTVCHMLRYEPADVRYPTTCCTG